MSDSDEIKLLDNAIPAELPRAVLERALTLRNAVRTIYMELCIAREAITAEDLAKRVKHARAYVNMRLNQLEDMGYITHTVRGKEKLYEAIPIENNSP